MGIRELNGLPIGKPEGQYVADGRQQQIQEIRANDEKAQLTTLHIMQGQLFLINFFSFSLMVMSCHASILPLHFSCSSCSLFALILFRMSVNRTVLSRRSACYF